MVGLIVFLKFDDYRTIVLSTSEFLLNTYYVPGITLGGRAEMNNKTVTGLKDFRFPGKLIFVDPVITLSKCFLPLQGGIHLRCHLRHLHQNSAFTEDHLLHGAHWRTSRQELRYNYRDNFLLEHLGPKIYFKEFMM